MPDALTTALIGVYALVMVSVGAFFSRCQGSSAAFYLAERTLGTFEVFGTIFSTFLGTGLVFTLASFGYLYGVGAFVLPGAAVIGFLLFAWVAPRIKALSDREEAITLPGLLGANWRPRTQSLAALITASLFAGTLAANLVAAGHVLHALVGIPLRLGVLVFAVVVVGYTVLGGFRGVVWTDIIQMGLVFVSLGLVVPVSVLMLEDPVILDTLPSNHFDPATLPTGLLVAYLFVGVFAFFGSQDLFQRVYAANDGTTARRGLLAFAATLAVVAVTAIALGIVARALHPDIVADQALVVLADSVVPPEFVGIALLGFLALANSDVDSQLLTVTSNVTQDIAPYLDAVSQKPTSVRLDRVAALLTGAIATIVAVAVPDLATLFNAVGSWFAILGFVVIATLFWERMTDRAAFAGLIVGFVTPVGFVALTGNLQAATMVGLLTTATTVGAIPFIAGSSK